MPNFGICTCMIVLKFSRFFFYIDKRNNGKSIKNVCVCFGWICVLFLCDPFYHNNEGYVLRRKHTKMTSK